MYKVIGADAKEYGPASVETLRRWIAEGRANADTRVQAEGASEWKTIGSLAEFAEALATAAATPPPPPAAPAASPSAAGSPAGATAAAATAAAPLKEWTPPAPRVDADALAAELCARDFALDIEGCVGRSWQLLKQNFWPAVAAWAISVIVQSGIGAIPYLGVAAGIVFGAVLSGGLYWFFLRLARGERVSVGDVFCGFTLALGPLILLGIVSSLLTGVGLILCILPGIYLAVAWSLAPLLVLDKKLEFWAALELSRKVITRHWFGMLGLWIVCFLLIVVGLLACCIGIFVTGPIATGAIAQAYRQLFEKPEAAAA